MLKNITPVKRASVTGSLLRGNHNIEERFGEYAQSNAI